jgi:hypothetical protein
LIVIYLKKIFLFFSEEKDDEMKVSKVLPTTPSPPITTTSIEDNNTNFIISNKIKTPPLDDDENDQQLIIPSTSLPALSQEQELSELKAQFQKQLQDKLFNNSNKSDSSKTKKRKKKSKKSDRRKDDRSLSSSGSKKLHYHKKHRDDGENHFTNDYQSNKQLKKKLKKKHRRHRHHHPRRLSTNSISNNDQCNRSNSNDSALNDYNHDDQFNDNLKLIDDFDAYEYSLSLRRSDRIKVIETKRQYHNEMRIAEKIKNFSSSNQIDIKSPDQTEPNTNEFNNNDKSYLTKNELASNDEENVIPTCFISELKGPIKMKDRWRRCSEIESESDINSGANSIKSSPVSTQPPDELNYKMSSPLSLNINHQTSSPSHQSTIVDSPKSFKKILLNKVVNETTMINQLKPTDIPLKSDKTSLIPTNYQQINENVYICKRKRNKFNKEAKKMTCDCSTSEQERSLGIVACGEDCLNRLLMIECGHRCPCGNHCTNKNFQNKIIGNIVPFETEFKGYGLKATSDQRVNTFLIEYIGEVVGLKEFIRRSKKYSRQNIEHFYFMSLRNDLFIDATKQGNISRFFNHSCDPNCETQKWTVNGELRIGFFTRRPVLAGEELTFDYQFQTFGKKQQKCYCGSEKCRGFLGASSSGSNNNNNEGDDSNSSSTSSSSSSSSSSDSEDDNQVKQKRKMNIETNSNLYKEISQIQSLSSRENVLQLCRLMFRTEDTVSRLKILDLLLNTKASEASLKLFADYHGLKLLCNWMIDFDQVNVPNESPHHFECKLKILKILKMMEIKNRSVLEECKILIIVKKWSEISVATTNEMIDPQPVDDNQSLTDWIKSLLLNLSDKAVNESEIDSKLVDLISNAKELFNEWNNLKQAFKIPKKQRIEDRKEHEREMNAANKETTIAVAPPITDIPLIINTDNSSTTLIDTNSPRKVIDSSIGRKTTFIPVNKYSQSFSDASTVIAASTNPLTTQISLTKEQRRQLFEQKVKEKEEADAAAMLALAAQTELEAQRRKEQETHQLQQSRMEWRLDPVTHQWVQCLVLPNSNRNTLMPPPVDLPPPRPKTVTDASQFNLNNLNLTDSNFENLKQAVQQIALQKTNDDKGNYVLFIF